MTEPADPPRAARIYYPVLDLLRFASALAVVLLHLGFFVWISPGGHALRLGMVPGDPPPAALFWWGGIGVQIFFVISGFVIAASANGVSPFAFVRSRIERLYPAVWLCALLSMATLLANAVYPVGMTLRLFARSAMLVPLAPWIDGQYWTLRAEIGFYATILLLLLTGRTRHFAALACGLILISLPSQVGGALDRLDVIVHSPFARLGTGVAQLAPIHFGGYFGLGMLLWLRHQRPLSRWAAAAIPVALASGALSALAHAHGSARNFAAAAPIVTETWWVPILVWFAACALIAMVRPLRLPAGQPMRRGLRVLRTLGLATYPLYLVHLSPGIWLIGALLRTGFSPLTGVAAAIGALVVLSILIALYGEPPLRALLRTISIWLFNRGWIPARALMPTPLIVSQSAPPVTPSTRAASEGIATA